MPERHSPRPLTDLFRHAAAGRSRRRTNRSPLSSGGRTLHLVSAVALLLGLVMQVTQYSQAFAAPLTQNAQSSLYQGSDEIAPAPVQVTVVGDFQTQLGCGASDLNCAATQLTNQNGLWTGSIPLPPGNYEFQIGTIGSDNGQYLFGRDGLNGDSIDLTVNEGDAGAYFSFNANTYEIVAEPLDAIYVLNTDVGTFPLGPDNNNLSTIVTTQNDGQLNVQLQVNGEPVGEPQSIDLKQGANRITVSKDGQIQNVDDLGYGTLTITRLDQGQPAPGGCYQVMDGNDVISQACDIDDGNPDGITTVTFAEGFDAGNVTIHEVITPEGIDPADDQDIDLQTGDNSAEIQTGVGEVIPPTEEGGDDGIIIGGETPEEAETPTEEETPVEEETPTEEQQPQGGPGDLIVTLTDDTQTPIGEACFQLLDDGGNVVAESCDTVDFGDSNPGNGNTGFFGVPSGTYTLHQSQAPEGSEPAADQQVDVAEGQSTNVVVTVAAASPEPTETPEQQTGDIVVLRQDQDGNPVGGACFIVYDQNGNQIGDETCDEDGDTADDGRTGFFDLPAGTLFLQETRTPDGVEPAPDQQFEVQPDQAIDVEVRTNLIEQPEEETPTSEEVTPTEEEVTPTEEIPTETPTAEGQAEGEPASGPPGDLIVTLHDENDQPVGGACFQLLNPDGSVAFESCDTQDDFPNNGNTGFFGIPSGNYTLHQSEVPDGTAPLDDQPITVDPSQSRTDIVQTSSQGGGADQNPTGEVTPTEAEETPTEEVTEAPTEGPTGVVTIDVSALAPNGETICIELNTGGTIGISNPPSACDNGDGDNNDDPGIIELTGVNPGDYQIIVTQGPEDALDAEPLLITVADDGSGTASFAEAAPQTGSLQISLLDSDNNSIEVDGGCARVEELNIDVCDNSDPDQDDATGTIVLGDIPVGTYTITGTIAPEGYDAASAPVTVDVPADDTGNADLVFPIAAPETGSIAILATDQNGEALPGACWSLSGDNGDLGPLCDDGSNGDTADDGQVSFADVVVGTYTVSETTIPDGYQPDETTAPITVDVVAGDNQPVTVQHHQTTGSLAILAVDGDGNPVAGACWSLSNDNGDLGPLCDDGSSGDTADDGQVTFTGIAIGTYTVSETTIPDGYSPIQTFVPLTVDVVAGENEPLNVEHFRLTGSLQISLIADDNPLTVEGGCVSITELDREICDNGDGDADPATGSILIEDVPFGDYTLVATAAPDGFAIPEIAGSATVDSVDAPATASLPFTSTGPDSGTITITVVDDANDQPIAAGCFDVTNDSGTFNFCDDDGDGTIQVPDVAFGSQTVTQSSATEGYVVAPDLQQFDLSREAPEHTAAFRNSIGVNAITITLILQGDNPNNPIQAEGGCVRINELDREICDNGEGDENPATGLIRAGGIPFGDYTISGSVAPEGYDVIDASVPAKVEASTEPTQVAIEFTETAPETGSIAILATDQNGEALPGACWSLSGDTGDLGPLCDDGSSGDTADDGQVSFADVVVGTYTVSETTIPNGYQPDETTAPITVDVVAGDNQPVTVSHHQAAISVTVSTSDGADGAPTGACYAIDGGDPICDEDGDGIVTFDNVTPGQHTFEQTTAPDGYQPADAQTVEIIPGDVESVVFTNSQPLNGSLLIVINDPDGNPLGEACATIAEGQTICDGISGDAATANGQILVNDLEPGDYSVTLSNLPQTVTVPEASPVTVNAGEQATVTFDLEAAPEQTGTVEIELQAADGGTPEGACVQLTNSAEGEQLGPFCDNDDSDTNSDTGTVTLEDIPVGTWLVSAGTGAEGGQGGAFSAAATTSSRTIQVQANVVVVVVIIIIGQPIDGALVITTRDANTLARLGGACYDLKRGNQTTSICDGDAADANGLSGVIQVNQLAAGSYTVTLTNDIPGYEQQTVPSIDITAGNTARINIDLVPLALTGTVVIDKVDDNDDPLGNACFALRQGSNTIAEECDYNDGEPNDGQLIFEDVPTGSYRLVETKTPSSSYQAAPDRTITVTAGKQTEVTVKNTARPADLVIRKVDADATSTLLQGACFSLQNDGGDTIYGSFCDSDDLNSDGRTRFNDVIPGTYTLVEDVAPYGYQKADSFDITIQPGVTQVITVQDEKLPPPADTGTLVITKQDGGKKLLPGACFRLYDGNSPLTSTVCDGTDGASDGTITLSDIPVGTWELREVVAPSEAYSPAAPQDVEITKDRTTNVTVVNQLKTGRIKIEKTNTSGSPLQNACFDILEDDAGQKCTNAAGELVFDSLIVGTYTIRETQAPYGYLTIKDKGGVKVYAGKTTVVEIVNHRIPPDPNTGSVQVLKFYCPAGEGGERTSFLGGAAGNAELAKTAGCEQGNAQFDLTQDDGDGGPGVFTTGTDGRYQVSVPSGTYTLEETDPDLEGNSSVKLVVYKNQLTTVVVINYLAPPEPDPITINVTKWTCDPSFNGTLYDDFFQNCTADSQLTNSITFRAEGPTNQKHITGDGGKVGQTSFTDLTAGTYTLKEEQPFDIPTSYGFCGYDAGWPADFKTVNGAFSLKLDWGQTLTCHFFNIPEDVTETTGVILVRKFVCNIDKAPKGYAWEEECGLSNQNARFALNSYNAKTQQFQEFSQGTANDDGFLRFTKLAPGTYELKEIDGTWCHAESDNVDAKGNMVVKAGKVSTVWIYNCVPTKNPPNTGSGDAAGTLDPTNGTHEGNGLPPVATPGAAIAWPLLLAAAWVLKRRSSSRAQSRDLGTVPVHIRRAA